MSDMDLLRNIPIIHFKHHMQDLDRDYRIFRYVDTSKESIYKHTHNFFELFILVQGHIKYMTAGNNFYLAPGDFLFINKNQEHLADVLDFNIPYDRIALHINPSTLTALSDGKINLASIFTSSEFRVYHYPSAIFVQIKEHLNRLAEIYYTPDLYGANILGRSELAELFIIFNQYKNSENIYSFDKSNKNLQLVSISKKYILNHINQKITNDDIAHYFLMNKYYFMHQFREIAGISFQQYVQNIRIEQVLERVKQEIPIMQAAQECGFYDYTGFYRLFKKQYGCSPSNYLKAKN